MFKKTISILLSSSMVLSMISPVLANDSSKLNEQDFFAVNNSHYTNITEFDGIKKSTDGSYAMEFESATRNINELYPVGRMDINIYDESTYSSDAIPSEIKDELSRIKESAIKSGNGNVRVAYFSPELLDTKASKASQETTYKNLNGYEMRNDRIYTYQEDTGYTTVSSGKNAQSVSSGLVDILLAGAGFVKKLNIVASGISLLAAFEKEYTSKLFPPTGTDYVQVAINFDSIRQFTYAKIGGEWQIGFISGQITVNEIDSRQYYWNSSTSRGQKFETFSDPNYIYTSNSFKDPWAKALKWAGNPESESYSWKIGSKTMVFF